MKISVNWAYRVFQIATIVLLSIGFVLGRIWTGVIIILAMIPFWWITQRSANRLFAWMALVILTGLAVFGLLRGVTPYLMIAGVSTSLACFELEDRRVGSAKNSLSSDTILFEKYHLRTVCLATAVGLMIAEAGLIIKFSLPFGVIFLAVILVLFGLFQLYSQFRKA